MKAAAVLLFLVAASHARPGENMEALEKRFGKPLPGKIGDTTHATYKANGYLINVVFDGTRKSSSETYELATGQRISEDQLDDLLRNLRGYLDLVEYKDAPNGAKRWGLGALTDHGSNSARLSPDSKKLTVMWGMEAIMIDSDDKKPSAAGF